MILDQIAYAVYTREDRLNLQGYLGLGGAEWIHDKVTARCIVWPEQDEGKQYGLKPQEHINIAELCFFVMPNGMQLEIIRYVQGANWLDVHRHERRGFFVSHVGWHLDDDEPWPDVPWRLAQEAWTMAHTNPYLTTGAAAGRKYHYRVYKTGEASYVKYIRRINP